MRKVYWAGYIGTQDDFGSPIDKEFIDGKTTMGPWAIMTPRSWTTYGIGELGEGRGQRYARTQNGKWMKIEG